MRTRTLTSELLLLLAAFIWGTTFVAQRTGMDHLGPFTYNGCRFGLGGLSLLAFQILRNRNRPPNRDGTARKNLVVAGLWVGLALFAGATFQQMGLVTTTAGKGGFITGLYVVLIPIIGLFLGHRISLSIWIGAALAVAGLYFLCITDEIKIERGDGFVLIGTLFWAIHVLLVGHFARRVETFSLAMIQLFVCSACSFVCAFGWETLTLSGIAAAVIPILYGGILSAGVAFSIQIFGQRTCPAAPAAIIMSMETVFAALAGWIVLGEQLSARNLIGCTLMLAGMLVVQLFHPSVETTGEMHPC
ncbi:MAG: DMT family transporter [Phycisphaerae bacterium]|nr:DMT family transporter [Phycisphaerae bacterium]